MKKVPFNDLSRIHEPIHKKVFTQFSKVLQENEQNSRLFKFVWKIKQKLYNSNTVDENFALLFMLNLSNYLGFFPSTENINAPLIIGSKN